MGLALRMHGGVLSVCFWNARPHVFAFVSSTVARQRLWSDACISNAFETCLWQQFLAACFFVLQRSYEFDVDAYAMPTRFRQSLHQRSWLVLRSPLSTWNGCASSEHIPGRARMPALVVLHVRLLHFRSSRPETQEGYNLHLILDVPQPLRLSKDDPRFWICLNLFVWIPTRQDMSLLRLRRLRARGCYRCLWN